MSFQRGQKYNAAVKPLETLLAAKLLSLHEGLLNSDRIVGCILLEHFNRRTGRCDPGIERIAKLAGVHVRTVIRAIARLVRLKLFIKIRHGGYSNRNSYEPNWQKFTELNQRWQAKFAQARATRESLSTELGRHVPGDDCVTQTYCPNQLKQTLENGSSRKEKSRALGQTSDQSSSQASRTAAHRRWDKDLLDHFRGRAKEYAQAVEAIDLSLSDRATDAELKQRGSGLEVIFRAIALKKRGEGNT
jgi:hypothetical protein